MENLEEKYPSKEILTLVAEQVGLTHSLKSPEELVEGITYHVLKVIGVKISSFSSQENLGEFSSEVIKALIKYDPEKAKFATFVSQRLKHLSADRKRKESALGRYGQEALTLYSDARQSLLLELQIDIDTLKAEDAAAVITQHFPTKKVTSQIIVVARMADQRVRELSLDSPIFGASGDGDAAITLQDTLAASGPGEAIDEILDTKPRQIPSMLSEIFTLTDRERKTLLWRYSDSALWELRDNGDFVPRPIPDPDTSPVTLKRVAQVLGISEALVFQTEKSALKKVREDVIKNGELGPEDLSNPENVEKMDNVVPRRRLTGQGLSLSGLSQKDLEGFTKAAAGDRDVHRRNSEDSLAVQHKPHGWLSHTEIKKKYIGGAKDLLLRLLGFRLALCSLTFPEDTHREWIGYYLNRGWVSLCVSPRAIKLLERKNILKIRKDFLPAPPEWQCASELEKKYSRTNGRIIAVLDSFRKELVQKGFSPESVSKEWVGYYRSQGGITLYASPQAVSYLVKAKKLIDMTSIPVAPMRWRSASILQNTYCGNLATLHGKLEALQKELGEVGIDAKTVQEKWVGFYRRQGCIPTLYASSRAIKRLEEAGHLRKMGSIPTMPDGWHTVSSLETEMFGSYTGIQSVLKEFYNQKISAGLSPKDVRKKWVGIYLAGNRPCYCISQKGVRELIQGDKLIPRGKYKNIPKGWATASDLKQQGIAGGTTKIIEQMLSLRSTLLDKEGLSTLEVQTDWVGQYIDGTVITWCASPKVVKSLIDSGSFVKDAKQKPVDWLCLSELRNYYVGGDLKIKGWVHDFREALIVEGHSAEEVENKWVGRFYVGKKLATCVSPQAIDALRQSEVLVERRPLLPVPEGWQSIYSLRSIFVGDALSKLQWLVGEKRSSGMPDTEIRNDWFGEYSVRGMPSMCASPRAIEALEVVGILVRKNNCSSSHAVAQPHA